ncbi:hypothetical protein ACFY86_34855 [Streptomyces misionensis]
MFRPSGERGLEEQARAAVRMPWRRGRLAAALVGEQRRQEAERDAERERHGRPCGDASGQPTNARRCALPEIERPATRPAVLATVAQEPATIAVPSASSSDTLSTADSVLVRHSPATLVERSMTQ